MVEEVSAPADAHDNDDEPAAEEDTPLPSFLRAETSEAGEMPEDAASPADEDDAEPAPEDATPPSALPSFLSDYAPATPTDAATEADAADPADATEPAAEPEDVAEPEFVADPEDIPASAAPEPDTRAEPEPEEDTPAVAIPKPRVVDVPDDPDPDSIAAKPSALTKATRVTQLTDAQRNMIRPLLAQLTALRDQMASNRREPR